jgi:uncharacterized protein YjiS (DUF1127 family)
LQNWPKGGVWRQDGWQKHERQGGYIVAITRSTHLTATLLLRLSQSFVPALDVWVEALRRVQIRRCYGRMSDATLRDIGLTPDEVEVALSLPLDRNAADFLARTAAAEAARW